MRYLKAATGESPEEADKEEAYRLAGLLTLDCRIDSPPSSIDWPCMYPYITTTSGKCPLHLAHKKQYSYGTGEKLHAGVFVFFLLGASLRNTNMCSPKLCAFDRCIDFRAKHCFNWLELFTQRAYICLSIVNVEAVFSA